LHNVGEEGFLPTGKQANRSALLLGNYIQSWPLGSRTLFNEALEGFLGYFWF